MYCRLKDLLRSDGSAVNDKKDQLNVYKQHSVNVSPNKEVPVDHTHWASGDDTDSDWASTPVKCHDNRTIPKSPPGITMRKHAGAKRSLFSLDDSSSQEQAAAGVVKKSMGTLNICKIIIQCRFVHTACKLQCYNYSHCYSVYANKSYLYGTRNFTISECIFFFI